MSSLPVIDLEPFATGTSLPSPESGPVAATIDAALREVGFLLVTGHGVDPAVKDALFEQMRDFFALDRAAKEALAIGNSPCHRGYVGFGTEALEGGVGRRRGRHRHHVRR